MILLVDDNDEYRRSTEDVLRRAGHTVLAATDGTAALLLARTQPIDLVLVDYHMPGMDGEEFVAELRKSDALVQVILQTGYARDLPPREMLRRMDIQGYYDKSEGPEKLLLATDIALKSATTVRVLESGRRGLRHILGITPELHRPQPVQQMLAAVLRQSMALLRIVDSFVVVPPPLSIAGPPGGFVAVVRDGDDLVIQVGTGAFAADADDERPVAPELARKIAATFADQRARIIDGAMVLPLVVGHTPIGAIYLEVGAPAPDVELFQILANQASVAIYNAHLHESAAIDKLTGACTRRFVDQSVMREIRAAHRFRMPLSLLMLDVDQLGAINEAGGHAAGDAVLGEIGTLLRRSTRSIDVVGRHGGDEFLVILAGTDDEGARVVADRILAGVSGLEVDCDCGPLPVSMSIGVATLHSRGEEHGLASLDKAAFDAMGIQLVELADRSLDGAKAGERGSCGETRHLRWTAARPADLARSA